MKQPMGGLWADAYLPLHVSVVGSVKISQPGVPDRLPASGKPFGRIEWERDTKRVTPHETFVKNGCRMRRVEAKTPKMETCRPTIGAKSISAAAGCQTHKNLHGAEAGRPFWRGTQFFTWNCGLPRLQPGNFSPGGPRLSTGFSYKEYIQSLLAFRWTTPVLLAWSVIALKISCILRVA